MITGVPGLGVASEFLPRGPIRHEYQEGNATNGPVRSGYGVQFGNDRGVVGRPFVLTGLDIDAAAAACRRQGGAEQDVIDSQAVIAVEGPRAIIPPAEGLIRLIEIPEHIL